MVQTFWSKPGKGNSLMDISAGWLSPEYHWMSWALSCLQAKKFYQDVELVTDDRGKEILINRLQLPYSAVTTSLEAALNPYPAELWSLAKIFSYSIQQEPFMHLDGDVFIWQPFDKSFCASGLLAQNIEVDIPYYRSMLTDINKRLKYVRAPFLFTNTDNPVYASNTGIFGGSNLSFIKEYCRQAFEFVDKNLQDITNFPAVKRPLLNFVFEQYLLFYLAADKKQGISYFIKQPVTDPSYRDYARLLDIPHVPLIHPVGAYKGRPFTCTQMARRLRKEYPDYYYRILDECKNEMRLVNKFYHLFEEVPSEVYKKVLADDVLKPSITSTPISNEPLPPESMLGTTAAINYMHASKIIQHTLDNDSLTENELRALSTTIADDHSKQLFTEIMELELQRIKVSKMLDQPTDLIHPYKEDIDQYSRTASLFAGTIDEPFLNTLICFNKDVILIELSHKWGLPASEDLTSFISEKWKEEPGLEQVVLWIDPELLEVNEMFLSHVEMIIISMAGDPITIRNVLKEARAFFDEKEIAQNPQSYIQLITNSIKLLLFSRILNTSKAFGYQS